MHRLLLADGSEDRSGGWPVRILFNPRNEKISSSLHVDSGYVYAATSGPSIKIGSDDLPRQGHLVAIELERPDRARHLHHVRRANDARPADQKETLTVPHQIWLNHADSGRLKGRRRARSPCPARARSSRR